MKEKINKEKLPSHIAIIMDGNGRWAKKIGNIRLFGHKNGVKAVKETIEASAELGIKYLTLYAFSTENWNRPKDEIDGLMSLLVDSINNELNSLNKNGIKLTVIGNILMLPQNVRAKLSEAIDSTSNNKGLNLIIALSYSGRWDIVQAVKKIAEEIEMGKLKSSEIDSTCFESYLNTVNIPDPELMIRTSGEFRISNFLLWQLAYSEIFITDTLWPDFRKEDLYKAIIDFQKRERRFGKTSEQINN